jgi:hypothetical protein
MQQKPIHFVAREREKNLSKVTDRYNAMKQACILPAVVAAIQQAAAKIS